MDIKTKQKLFYNEARIEDYIPYSHFYAKDVLMTKASDMLSFIEIKGIDTNQHNVSKNINALIKAISQLDSNVAIWVNSIRDKINNYELINTKSINNKFSSNFINDYQNNLIKSDLYETRLILTIVVRPNLQKLNKSLRLLQEKYDKENIILNFNNQYKKISEIKEYLLSALSNFNPRVLKLSNQQNQEILSFLGYALNLEYQNIAIDKKDISKIVNYKKHFFVDNIIEIQGVSSTKYAAILAIKNYSDKTFNNILNKLNSINCSYINTHIFKPVNLNSAKDLIVKQKNRLNQVGDYAVSQIDELDTALDDLQSQRISFGYHSNTILIFDNNLNNLDERLNLISRIFLDSGIIVTREALNLESSFMSILPANFSYVTRKYLISSKNFIDLLNLEYSDTGYINQII